MTPRKLTPLDVDGDREVLFSALAQALDEFAVKHGKNKSSAAFSGPFAVRIMAACQQFVDGQDLTAVCDRLLSIEQLKAKSK